MARAKTKAKTKTPPKAARTSAHLRRNMEKFFLSVRAPLGKDDFLRRDIPFYSAAQSADYVRRIAQKSDVLTSIIKLIRRQAIGETPVAPRWGNVGNEYWRDAVRDLWEEWQAQVTADGQQSLLELQASFCETLPVDGVALADIRYHADYKQGIAVMPIPRQFIAENYTDKARRVSGGNEYTKSGVINAYWVYEGGLDNYQQTEQNFSLGGLFYGGFMSGGKMVRIPARQCARLSVAGRIDDYERLPSPLLATVNSLRQIALADDATIKATIAAAVQMLIIEKGADAEIEDTGGIPEEMRDRESEVRGSYYEVFDGGQLEAGGLELPYGYKANSYTPASPSGNATEFRKAKLMSAIASCGLDYFSATGDAGGVNFSSLRHFNLQSRALYREYQHCIAERLMRKLIMAWLSHHRHTTGALAKAPEKAYREMQRVTFRKKQWQWIQPVEEQKRWSMAIKDGVASPQMAAAAAGIDFGEVREDLYELIKIIRECEEQNDGATPAEWNKVFAAKGGGKDGGADGEEDDAENEDENKPENKNEMDD